MLCCCWCPPRVLIKAASYTPDDGDDNVGLLCSRVRKRGGKGRDYSSSRFSSSSSSSSSSPLKEDDDDDDFDDKEDALDETQREGGGGGSSVVAQTTTGAAVDDAAMLSNIGDRTSQKRKEEEFASMLNAAQRYSERNNNNNNNATTTAATTTTTPAALASGAEDGTRTAEERIAAARGYAKKNEKTTSMTDVMKTSSSPTNEKDDENEGDDGRRQQKSVNVQIISKDTSYNPFDEDESIVGLDDVETGVNYKPKVSTWGYFRVRKISRKSTAAEDVEERRKRTKHYRIERRDGGEEDPRGKKVGEISNVERVEHDERGGRESEGSFEGRERVLTRRERSERYCGFRAIPTGHQRAIGVRRTGDFLLRDVFG